MATTSLMQALQNIRKQAAVATGKRAEDALGGTPPQNEGDTSHQSGSGDDGTTAASGGARESEHETDLKANIDGVSVESAPNSSLTTQPTLPNSGPKQSLTGEDPSVSQVASNAPDTETAHPATTEGGEKYSSLSFAETRKKAAELSNAMLAAIVMHKQAQKTAGEKTAAASAAATSPAPTAQYQAGYELAQQLQLSQQDAQRKVAEVLSPVVADAQHTADLVVWYLQKKAEEDGAPMPEAEPTEQATPPGGPGAAAGAVVPPPEAAPPGDMMPPGGMPPDAGAAMPPGAGGDPAAAGGEDPEAEMAMFQELLAVLEQNGLTIQDLLAMLQESGGPEKAANANELRRIAKLYGTKLANHTLQQYPEDAEVREKFAATVQELQRAHRKKLARKALENLAKQS